MKPLIQEELTLAFNHWNYEYQHKDSDKLVEAFLQSEPRSQAGQNSKGWLRRARTAQFYSAQTIADRLKISRSTYSEYESCEENGNISLNTLAKAAEAMDCELVYAIRPKNRESFSKSVWVKLLTKATKHPWLEKCDQKRRGMALAKLVKDTFNDTEFRRKQGWSSHA